MDKLLKQPWLGLCAWAVAFFSQPVGHTLFALIRSAGPVAQYVVAFVLGLVALWVIGSALRRDELGASLAGFFGGWLLWSTWASFGFVGVAFAFDVPQLDFGMGVKLPRDATVLMATGPLLFMLFALYGLFNRETRCNLMRFLMRHSKASPGMPTGAAQRSYARIVAMETIFIIWTLYIFWLYAMWFFMTSPVFYLIFCAYVVWSLYLLYKLFQVPRPAHALRYGVPAGIISWSLAEMPAHWGMYREAWLYPYQYPLVCTLMISVFLGAMLVFLLRSRRGVQRPAAQAA